MKHSIIIPVYKNESSIIRLLDELELMNQSIGREMEVIFVVDGSPDKSFELLKNAINTTSFSVQLIAHSRNFGSFAAIRTGLIAARGDYFGVMSADLQEPPELLLTFFKSLSNDECDVAIGTRNSRNDPFLSRLASSIFWNLYRRIVVQDMPEGGVDVFGCNSQFRNELIKLEESRSSLIALIFWLGFRRKFIGYERLQRKDGVSAWTLKKKLDYMFDSISAFTDYPIRMLIKVGMTGFILATLIGVFILFAKLAGAIVVPGYAATMIVVLMFGALNLLGLGLVGNYAWRAYENSKRRPLSVVAFKLTKN
jgi:polyisoprenyl-phosphate glycosyltransferase